MPFYRLPISVVPGRVSGVVIFPLGKNNVLKSCILNITLKSIFTYFKLNGLFTQK